MLAILVGGCVSSSSTILFIVMLKVISVSSTSDDVPDFRTVTYDELRLDPTTKVFGDRGFEDFSQIVVDVTRQQIIVGLKDNLLRVRLNDLELIELAKWAPDNITVTICLAKGQKLNECHNFIRVLAVHQDNIFACGTNAYAPFCSWRKIGKLNEVVTWMSGVAKCPYSPRENITYLMTANSDFYIGTVTDFTGRDAVIYRMLGPSRKLRTAQYNSRWLNEPNFISSYEIGDYVYFFFREAAVEYINCGKAIYSRVARICKNDRGGKVLLEDNWTTFVKARLNCSAPGSYPFYFNELQSTYYMESEQLIYATFTTSPNSIYGSAICVYNLTAIDEALNGPFKYQENAHSAWTRVTNTLPGSCSAAAHHSQRHLLYVQKHQMMDNAVQPVTEQPAIVVEKERFSHIVVDRVNNAHHSKYQKVDVVFVATVEGVIKKYSLLSNSHKIIAPCLIEEIHITQSKPVKVMKLNDMSLVVGSSSSLYKISVHRCDKLVTRLMCLGLQDPYCGWDSVSNQCVAMGHPHLTSTCSDYGFPVNGAWSEWSDWEPCYGDHLSDEKCLCRTRSCDQPKPNAYGLPCSGPRVQVVNCSLDGQWSDWSEWSQCSTSADQLTFQTRSRTCSRPTPRHGGKECDGDITQNKPCSSAERLVQSSSNADARQWSEWTSCSVKCGNGHQTRHRAEGAGHKEGTETDRQVRSCYAGKCPIHRKTSDWSNWQSTQRNADGSHLEERARCVCRARVPHDSLLRTPSLRTELRQCSAESSTCFRLSTTSKMVLSTTPMSVSTPTMCQKCTEPKDDRVNSILDKNSMHDRDVLSDGTFPAMGTAKPITGPRRYPANHTAVFCDCRDLGPLRVCRRCSTVYSQHRIKAQSSQNAETSENLKSYDIR